MVRQPLVILFLLVLTVSVDGWWWSHRRRNTVNNHCHCPKRLTRKLENVRGRRDLVQLLDLEENHPGLESFLDHLDAKRDGTIDSEALATLLERYGSNSAPVKRASCNCGRSLVDHFNQGLL